MDRGLTELVRSFAANPSLERALAERVARFPQWTLPDFVIAPVPSPLTAETQTLHRRTQLEWLALGLSTSARARAAFEDILSATQLAAIAAQAEALTPSQTAWLRKLIDLDDVASVHATRERLERLSGDAARQPSLSAKPASADAASLTAYLSQPQRSRTLPGGMRLAIFKADHYESSYEPTLRALGYHVVVIEAPSGLEVERLVEAHGFSLKTRGVQWNALATPDEERCSALVGQQARTNWRRDLKRAARLVPRLAPLSEEAFDAWYAVYRVTLDGREKNKAVEAYTAGFVKTLRQAGTLDLWTSCLYDDPDDPERLIGGALLSRNVVHGSLTIAAAAYLQEYKKLGISRRTISAAHAMAMESGTTLVSYGADPNFYGGAVSVGLASHKVEVGFTPSPVGVFELVKIIDPAVFAAESPDPGGARPGFMCFVVLPGSDLWQRYLARRATGDAPVGVELLGGRFLSPGSLVNGENIVCMHLHFPGEVTSFKTPHGIPVVRRVFGEV